MRRLVSSSLNDGGETLLGDREEGVSGRSSSDGVDGDVDRSVLRKRSGSEWVSVIGEVLDERDEKFGLTVPFLNPTAMDNAEASSR